MKHNDKKAFLQKKLKLALEKYAHVSNPNISTLYNIKNYLLTNKKFLESLFVVNSPALILELHSGISIKLQIHVDITRL